MPKESDTLNRGVIIRSKLPAQRAHQNPRNQTHTSKNVNRMQTRHHEVKREVQREIFNFASFTSKQHARVQTVVELVRVLDVLNTHENRTANNRNHKHQS